MKRGRKRDSLPTVISSVRNNNLRQLETDKLDYEGKDGIRVEQDGTESFSPSFLSLSLRLVADLVICAISAR